MSYPIFCKKQQQKQLQQQKPKKKNISLSSAEFAQRVLEIKLPMSTNGSFPYLLDTGWLWN